MTKIRQFSNEFDVLCPKENHPRTGEGRVSPVVGTLPEGVWVRRARVMEAETECDCLGGRGSSQGQRVLVSGVKEAGVGGCQVLATTSVSRTYEQADLGVDL